MTQKLYSYMGLFILSLSHVPHVVRFSIWCSILIDFLLQQNPLKMILGKIQ